MDRKTLVRRLKVNYADSVYQLNSYIEIDFIINNLNVEQKKPKYV